MNFFIQLEERRNNEGDRGNKGEREIYQHKQCFFVFVWGVFYTLVT